VPLGYLKTKYPRFPSDIEGRNTRQLKQGMMQALLTGRIRLA
jgi:hypothetical protein